MLGIPIGRHLFTLSFLPNETQRADPEEIFALRSQRRQSDGIPHSSPSPVDLPERSGRATTVTTPSNAQSTEIDEEVDRPSLPRLSRYDSTTTSRQRLDHSAHLRRRRRFGSLLSRSMSNKRFPPSFQRRRSWNKSSGKSMEEKFDSRNPRQLNK